MVNYGLGVPVKVLHEAEGHVVTVEASTGELYRGTLIEAEDNMNLQVRNCEGYKILFTGGYLDARCHCYISGWKRCSLIKYLHKE